MKPGKTGIRRLIDATGYSWLGFKAAYKHEAAFRQELAGVCVAMPVAAWLCQNATQFLLLTLPLLLLLLVELANSAIEAVVDRYGSEFHELSGRAKDMGSAMVFMALLIVAVSWCAVLAENYL
ncbi:MAG: diacylglycerol kinase [Halioglobus sp.]